jgi:hypothetical protein
LVVFVWCLVRRGCGVVADDDVLRHANRSLFLQDTTGTEGDEAGSPRCAVAPSSPVPCLGLAILLNSLEHQRACLVRMSCSSRCQRALGVEVHLCNSPAAGPEQG